MIPTLQQNLGVSFFILPNVLGLKAFNKNRFSYFIVVGKYSNKCRHFLELGWRKNDIDIIEVF